jgi:hypothetical protein
LQIAHAVVRKTALDAAQVGRPAALRFQAWYRDPLAGMSGINLSDGIGVTLSP